MPSERLRAASPDQRSNPEEIAQSAGEVEFYRREWRDATFDWSTAACAGAFYRFGCDTRNAIYSENCLM